LGMYRVIVALLLLICVVDFSHAGLIRSGIDRRASHIVTVYDRNCFFSPIGCHFLQGRRALTFITPGEAQDELRFNRFARQEE
ncbi:hypothetical protein PMAYCL1PPCAC_16611, partial [Pristionchus mayeri]